jgi:conjugative transfer signal peptidase TraF
MDLRRTEISITPLHKTRPLLVVVASIAVLFALPHWFTVNQTASSTPKGIYRRTHRAFKRGDLVEACLTHRVAIFAASRAYIRATGRCADNSEPVIKKIGGMPGDRVFVNPTSILATDSGGRPMPMSFPGWHEITAGQVWLSGSARNSFDSRYFSTVPINNVKAVLTPLWTW